jgi:tetratricopeptide (TPR) repeat protein
MRLLLFLLAGVTLFSCDEQNPSKTFLVMSKDALFDQDSINAFLSTVPDSQSDSSKQAFLRGIDFLKNSRNAKEAINYLHYSIRVYPNANAYYELGNAYLENKDPQAALQSFRLAEMMNYKPLGNVFFRQASCYAAMDSLDQMYNYVKYAVQNGFVDKRKILEDVHFANYKTDYQLLNTYNEAMGGNGDPDEVLWHSYSSDFKQAGFPLTVDSSTLRKLGQPLSISYDYEKFVPEMRDNKFSRDVGNEYFYVSRILQTELCHVVLYGCRPFEYAGAPAYYILASFTPKGKLVDKMIVGGAKSFDEAHKVFIADNSQHFRVEEYKNIYEKSTDEYGYENNKIVSQHLVATKQFLINAQGKFVSAQQS